MEEVILTKEQKEDFGKSLLQNIKEMLKNISRKPERQHSQELEEELLSNTKSDEERETLQEIFDEIKLTNQKRKEFAESGKNIVQWQDEEWEKIAKKADPNASKEEIDKLKEAVARRTDLDIERYSNAIEQMHTEIENSKEEEGRE